MNPPALDLGAEIRPYGIALWVLLALFIGRVVGQMIVMRWHPRWLPAPKEWYSGVMSYPTLLPTQIVFIVVMWLMAWHLTTGRGWFVERHESTWLIWFSLVYAAAMVLRYVKWRRTPVDRRRAWIPIIFHIVLAAFLFVYGSWQER
jgi:hypothetical protein